MARAAFSGSSDATAPSRGASAGRSAYWDNAKALLIILVVFGHLVETNLRANTLYLTLYPLIYAFHMPAFAFVTGYLSKADAWTGNGIRKIGRLVLIYLLFQGIYTGAKVLTASDASATLLKSPVASSSAVASINKSVDFDGDGTFADDSESHRAGPADWRIVITNRSDARLMRVAVTDSSGRKWGPLNLPAGESKTFDYSAPANISAANVATMTALAPDGSLITLADSAVVRVTGPAINLKLLLEPVWVMWWILALIIWRLALPAFSLGRSKAAAFGWVALAVALGLASGWFLPSGALLSLSRTFVLFPFFLAGFWAKRANFRSVRRTAWTRIAAMFAFFAAGWVIVWIRTTVAGIDGIRLWTLLWARATYAEMPYLANPALARAAVYIASAVLVAAFFQLVPKSRSVLTALGMATLSIFLWHGLAVMLLAYAHLTSYFLPSVILTALVAVGLSVVLGVGPIAEWTERLLRGRSMKRG